ncbi:MAG: class I SAM-dependent rRNA methyltransferase [Bryobacterales bacterium]|nr:class I SAM-dependent rRNA methyltransferase [Bryobacteraceae bacterium]MDW8354816.1 class I SAM-dependent rRNA methyltransferase [Bryobacterales bacterium]
MAASAYPTVRVNAKAAGRLRAGHPWIFASDVEDRDAAQPGDAVVVMGPRGRVLGMGHYSSASLIALRVLSERAEPIGPAFFRQRLEEAHALRRRVVTGTDAYRLVHAEGDRLPALIVDRYGDYFVLQALSQGMDRAQAEIAACLAELFHPAGILARNDALVRQKEGLPLETSVLAGEVPQRVPVNINGLRFVADLFHGQKTGLFLDQRENYLAAAAYARGRALDCFTFTGGFALHLAGVCERVEAVDSSAAALALAEENRAANGLGNVTFREADVFQLLSGYASAGRQFDVVVLDPPAFAKSRRDLERAAAAYKEINLRALKLLSSGGVLVTCSCSHHLPEASFLEIVASASLDAGRPLRVLERRTQARDHPILLTVPETQYLKCLIAQVL